MASFRCPRPVAVRPVTEIVRRLLPAISGTSGKCLFEMQLGDKVQQMYSQCPRLRTQFLAVLLLSVLVASATASDYAGSKVKRYASPDGKYVVLISALPKARYGSGESEIALQTIDGKILCSKSYGSADGEHGFGVERAAWTPDSQFFVYSMSSSGGHQSWHFPTHVISIRNAKIMDIDNLLGPVTDPNFELQAPNILKAVGRDKKTLNDTTFEVKLSALVGKGS